MTRTKWMAALAGTVGVVSVAGGLAWASSGDGWRDWDRPGPAYGMAETFDQFDRDDDSRITRSEAEQFRSERLARFDANGDGSLDLDEYRGLWIDAMQRAIVRAFQRHDVNGDGTVTAAEFARPIDLMFMHLDRDGNGVIEPDELRRRYRFEERRQYYRPDDDD